MDEADNLRPGELTTPTPGRVDAGITFIGRIRTPFATHAECPKNTRESDALARVEIDADYMVALDGVALFSHLILLYWMDEARRDLLRQVPRHLGAPRGTFALRSPARPNPIALAVVALIRVEGPVLIVRNIDCRDGTPLLDIKPYYASTDSFPDALRP